MTNEEAIADLELIREEMYDEEYGEQTEDSKKFQESLDMAISALSAFEGMTNGEVIKALFPKAEIYVDEWKGLKSVVVWFEDAKVPHTFVYEWWNAPYKAESEGKE